MKDAPMGVAFMKEYNVAVLGATGAVGREMMKILEERNFPVKNLIPLASARSAGMMVGFHGENVTVREVSPTSFAGVDIVLGAAPNKLAREYAPHITAAGAVFVDNSSAFRMDADVPLVIPEINPEDATRHHGIISNPNCSTIVTLVAVNAIGKLSPIRSMTVSTYQAVSGAGAGGPVELEAEIAAISAGARYEPSVFPYQIAYNLIPQIGDFLENGYTAEEMKMQNEGRKILHLPELRVGCTCVRVPIVRSHSISVSLITERQVSPDAARAAVAVAPGCRLVDDPAEKRYPMPLDTSDQDLVFVGRIRQDIANENGLSLWCCGDQVRKGAATNTVQIAELLIQ